MTATYPGVVRRREGDAAGLAWRALMPVVVGFVVTGLPIYLHLISQPVAIVAAAVMALIIANFAAGLVPSVLLVSFTFQNLFVAFVSGQLDTLDQLNSIRAYNFVLTAVMWVVLAGSFWTNRFAFDRRMRFLMGITTAALVLIGFYFVYGYALNSSAAVVYLRNIALPFLLIQIFAIVAYRHGNTLSGPAVVIGLLLLVYGYLELCFGADFLATVGGDSYLTLAQKPNYDAGLFVREMQATGRVMRSYFDTLEVDFLNTPLLAGLDLKFDRLVGPNFHSISFAYGLSGLAVMLSAFGVWWYGLAIIPLLVVIGSKGALVMIIFVALSLAVIDRFGGPRRLSVFVVLLALYAAAGIVTDISAHDYHVLGFIGGLRGFLANPIGHGIGSGGNLSLPGVAEIDWSHSQETGHTDIAVESAIGVLLFQMGVAGIALIGILLWLANHLWRLHLATRQRVYAAGALGILAITVNGIFQEEAMFAPLALGVMAALAGLLLGDFYRNGAASGVRARA